MYKAILVYVDGQTGSDERTRLAIGLARRYDAALIGLAAAVPRLPIEIYANGVGAIGIGTDLTEFERTEINAELGTVAARFEKATLGSGLKVEWRAEIDSPSTALVRAAGAADLIVLSDGDGSLMGDFRSPSPGEVLMRSGRPVLMIPKGLSEINARKVLVAWKDTREARRAMVDALPFMKRAASVVLLHVGENGEEERSLGDAQAFLARHGIAVVANNRPRAEGTVASEIVRFAGEMDADLIVAGAYGHSRLREWVFGGVTRGLLAHCPMPHLSSH